MVLLNHGANPNLKCHHHGSLLLYAAMHNRTEIFQLLIQHGAEKDTVFYDTASGVKHTPLCAAVNSGNITMVSLLLECNVDLTFKSFLGTPLKIAKKNGFREIADKLTEAISKRSLPNLSIFSDTRMLMEEKDELSLNLPSSNHFLP